MFGNKLLEISITRYFGALKGVAYSPHAIIVCLCPINRGGMVEQGCSVDRTSIINWSTPHFSIVFRRLGWVWPWMVTFDGFNTINSVIRFATPTPTPPNLVRRKHPIVLYSNLIFFFR